MANIRAGVVGLGAAIDYVTGLDINLSENHERDLLAFATARAVEQPGLLTIGTAEEKAKVQEMEEKRATARQKTAGEKAERAAKRSRRLSLTRARAMP